MSARFPLELELRDGSHVVVRPGGPEDRALLAAGFERLSAQSRYKRFMVPVASLSEADLTYLTGVDHVDHEALAAIDPGSGAGVGVARFVRLADAPDTAEAAVTVIDAWQGRGLGAALLELLADRAREEGIKRFRALVLARNREVLDLLGDVGDVRVIDRQLGTLEVETELPPQGTGEALRHVLRASARGAGDHS